MTRAGFDDGAAPVQAERRGPFWFARLHRPDRRNVLSAPVLDALTSICEAVEADAEARALVLWGAGGNFCAGADFAEFERSMAADDATGSAAEHNRAFGRVLERLATLPVPTIAVVRGAAMGGGCGLAATLDRVIAAEDATFAMPEVTLGVAPAQIAPFVVRRVGATRGRWLMLGAGRLDADAAVALGLADVAAPIAGLAAAVQAELQALGAAQPRALRATKRLTLTGASSLGELLDGAAREFAALLRAGAVREGIAAVRGRRRPAWHVDVPDLPEFT
jgi:isohexenylglutaconyl-CoA hydratase